MYSKIPGVDCVINPYRVADLASPVAGVIDELYVKRSQQVKAGQVVVQMEADVDRANVELARYRAEIQSEIRLGQVNKSFDDQRKKRIDTLHLQQASSVEDKDEARREAGLSRWKLAQARELAEIRKLELRRSEQQLRQKSIKAPFDGFVLDTFKYPGEYVEDKAILRLAQLDPLVVEAIVPMENFGEVKVGMMAEVLPEVYSTQKLSARVTIVDRIGDTASSTFGVRLVMPNPQHLIPAGLKCVVKFIELNPEQLVHRLEPQTQVTQTRAEVPESIDSTILFSEKASEPLIAKPVLLKPKPMPEVTNITVEANTPGTKSPIGYFVVIPQAENGRKTRALIQQLVESGIDDVQEMDRGPYQGLVLLGLYNRLSAAKRREQSIKDLGYSASIRERY